MNPFINSISSTTISPVTPPPTGDTEALVYAFAGQSNMLRGETSELDSGNPEHAVLLQPLEGCFVYNASTAAWEQMQAGVNTHGLTQTGSIAGQFGPLAKFAQLMHEYTGKNIYCYLYAEGGTYLANSGSSTVKDWHPVSNELWGTWKTRFRNEAIPKLTEGGLTPIYKAFAWWQGESDANSTGQSRANAYEANETALFADLEANVPELANVKRVVFKIIEGYTLPYAATVNAAKASRAAGDTKTLALLSANDYPLKADNLHATGPGQVMAGTDMFNLLKDL